MKRLEHYWQTRNGVAWALLPLSWLYCLVVALRRAAYRSGMLVSRGLPVPVIVVGNISVGGTGKTPLVIDFAERCLRRGPRPAVVARGYRSPPAQSPDELMMI